MNKNDRKRLKINEWKTGINKGGKGGPTDPSSWRFGPSAREFVGSKRNPATGSSLCALPPWFRT